MDSFVLGVSEGKGVNEKYVEKVRKLFQTHHRWHRNFIRKGKNHNHAGWASTMRLRTRTTLLSNFALTVAILAICRGAVGNNSKIVDSQ